MKRLLLAAVLLVPLATCTAVEPSYAQDAPVPECVTPQQIQDQSGSKWEATLTADGSDIAVELFSSTEEPWMAFITVTEKGCIVGGSTEVPKDKILELAGKTGLKVQQR